MTMPLPVLEVLQMMGRAGRPRYDNVGEAWLLAKSRDEESHLVNLYLHGEPEEVTSKLANPNALRAEEDPALLTHVLSMIATGGTDDRDALGKFFSKTFLATQLDPETLAVRIDDVVSWLAANGMIDRLGESDEVRARILEEPSVEQPEEWEDELPSWVGSASKVAGLDVATEPIRRYDESPRRGPPIFGFRKASMHDSFEAEPPESPSMAYSATPLGDRVAQLYLNPISGRIIRDGLGRAMATLTGEDDYRQVSPLSLLHLVSCTPDFMPLWPRKGDYDAIQAALHGHEREFLAEAVDLDEERRMKGVLVLQSWTEEARVERIERDWGVQPGDLRGRVGLAEWLLYATRRILAEDEELASMDSNAHRTLVEAVDEVHRRVRYGCNADLLGLVALRGVGRSRARQMVNLLGVSNAADVAALTERDMQKLSDLRGWSLQLVDGLVATAGRAVKRGSR
jgi:helicase